MALEPADPRAPVQVGDVISLAEEDYQYGRGRLRLRVTVVHAQTIQMYHGEWVWLDGVEISWDGAEGLNRRVLARISGIHRKTA